MLISLVFNIENFFSYRDTFVAPLFSGDDSTGSMYSAPVLPVPCVMPTEEVINVVMDEETISVWISICSYLVQ